MSITPEVQRAINVVNAAWQQGRAFDLASQAAFALESARLLMSPETAAELERLRNQVDELASRSQRYRTAWRVARTRALSTGSAADRYVARAAELQTALQDSLVAILGAQMERDALVAERASTNAAVADAAVEREALLKQVAELEAAARPVILDLPPNRQTRRLLAEGGGDRD